MGIARSLSQHSGMSMKQMVASHLGPISTGSSYPQPSTLSPKESARNYKIAGWLNSKNWMGNVIRRVVLPGDMPGNTAQAGDHNHYIQRAQDARQAEFMRQSAMPWGNSFMHTPTDAQRLNNPSQSAFVKQRQLTIPSSYGQFYAFMHALSAAFGTLQAGGS